MRIAFVFLGKDINGVGFRRVAAVSRKIEPSTEIFFVPVDNGSSFGNYIFPSRQAPLSMSHAAIIGTYLSKYDLVCFSSMSDTIEYVANISKEIKKNNSKVFILIGGVHATLSPDEAINIADAICVGEGEKAFRDFLTAFFGGGGGYLKTKGLRFKNQDKIIKNLPQELNTNTDLDEFQIGYMDFDCKIYDKKKNFRQLTKHDYLRFNGLTYNPVWTLGCPFLCSYCSNSGFAELDKGYLKLRYPSPEIIIKELEEAVLKYTYINRISFQDDNLIALPYSVFEKFACLYKEKINIPFIVAGIHPNTLNKEKVELLCSIGMIRVRMGIQSGSEKILKLYERNTPLDKILQASEILGNAAKKYKMIPPTYDIILDNPIETRDDIIATLRFYNKLTRPLTLNVYSLRAFPGTKLGAYFNENHIDCYNNDNSYFSVKPALSNILIYIIAITKIPNKILEHYIPYIKGFNEKQKEYPILLNLTHFLYLCVRGFGHLKKMDFSFFTGSWLYYYWKLTKLFGWKRRNM
jgi:radical SAM superfamily enzyme YgiQ (UPF0313 family)